MAEFNLSDFIHLRSPHIHIENIKEFIRLIGNCDRFQQTGKELSDELNIKDSKIIQKIQLMFAEILIDIEELAGDKFKC